MKAINLFMSTNDATDIVTLSNLKRRYVDINETADGFEQYLLDQCVNGWEKEYLSGRHIPRRQISRSSWQTMTRETHKLSTMCGARLNQPMRTSKELRSASSSGRTSRVGPPLGWVH